MARLSDEELRQIQTFIERGKKYLDEQGLSLEVDSDLREWVKLARRAPGATGAASTHDPSRSNIHPGNAFWVIVRENTPRWWERPLRRKGPIVSCLCHKVVQTDDIVEEIRTHRLFFDKKPTLDYQPVEIIASDNMPTIGGRVGFGGGFWVHPKYRGRNVANVVSRLTRVLSLRHYDIDWTIVLVKDTERRKLMIHNTFGMPHSLSISRGYYPPYATNLDIQLGYMHRDEIIRQVYEENRSGMPTEKLRAGTYSDQPANLPKEQPKVQQGRASVH